MSKEVDKLIRNKEYSKLEEISQSVVNMNTLLKIGKFFFEEGKFEEAIKCLSKISNNLLCFPKTLWNNVSVVVFTIILCVLLYAGLWVLSISIEKSNHLGYFISSAFLILYLLLFLIWTDAFLISIESLFYAALTFAHLGDLTHSAECFSGYFVRAPNKKDKCIEGIKAADNFNYAAAYTARGLAYRKSNPQRALEDFNKAIEISPDYVEAYIKKFNIYYVALNDYDKAKATLEQIITISTDKQNIAFSYVSLADINSIKNLNDTETLNLYNKAVEIYSCALVHFHRAAYFFEKKEYRKALNDYEICIQKEPDCSEYYLLACNCYIKLGEYDKAFQKLELAEEKGCNTFDKYCLMTDIYNAQAEYVKVVEYGQKALKLNPKEPKLYVNLANVNIGLGNYKKAIEYLNKAIRLNGDLGRIYHLRGVVYRRMNKYKKAYKDYLKSLNIGGADLELLNYDMAKVLIILNKKEEAIKTYEKILEINPNIDKSEYYLRYGLIFIYGDPEEALSKFNQALKFAPESAFCYLNIAIAYFNLEEFEKANENFNRYIELEKNPGNLREGILELRNCLNWGETVTTDDSEIICKWIKKMENLLCSITGS